MALYRAFATVGGMTVLSRVLGFARDMLLAALLGASATADAFFVAFRIPNLFRRLFAEGAFDSAFVPLFTKRYHGEGEADARAFAERAMAGLAVVLIVFTLLGEIAMPWLMLLLAPGFSADPDKFALAVSLGRIALPYLLCMSLVALYSGMLNALGRFAVAAFVPTLLNVVLILALLGCVAFGISENQPLVGHVLAWAITVSGAVQVAAMIFAAAKYGLTLKLRAPVWNDDMRRLVRLATPGLLAGGIAQLSIMLGTIIASFEDRVVSWLYYADRIFQLPLGVIGVAIGVVLLPELSQRLRHGDHAAVVDAENRSIEFALFLTIPAAVALILIAEPIIRVLFERGAFTAIDTRASADMLVAFALGLPAYVLVKIFNPLFFAREDTKTPMICAGHALAANAVLSLGLFYILGAIGIAIATAMAGWVNLGLLVYELKRREGLAFDDTFKKRFRGTLLASLVMGIAVYLLEGWFDRWFMPGQGLLIQGLALLVVIGGGLAVYFGATELLGVMSLRRLRKNLNAA
ncbi:putative peptidoglycan biosynthesis protein MurJ [Methyloligella halotolerans]|uniref:Probable lipid II flippase MurJ n=1 Tax=Methyloligella halotolerans TaxID=1177755 RepID=A0A1E2S0F9_9HYPH|nr:murein biosynthesis integral membrane protein MurJ [Methyloligella halotolerans]ODA67880.1 putative peptidoglycan biosynthesis protein MurJ [Methyloligella halotolerans]